MVQRERISQRKLDQQALVLSADTPQAAVEKAGLCCRTCSTHCPRMPAWATGAGGPPDRCSHAPAGAGQSGAIHEYGEASQRSDYLDSQHADLTTALETLEDAIRKIDRETRGRFKDTLDRVNAGVQALYPRLFGGYHAYLELTGEDLLDTGVTIMARPPARVQHLAAVRR